MGNRRHGRDRWHHADGSLGRPNAELRRGEWHADNAWPQHWGDLVDETRAASSAPSNDPPDPQAEEGI